MQQRRQESAPQARGLHCVWFVHFSDSAICRQWNHPIEEIPKITTWLMDQLGDYVPERDYPLQVVLIIDNIDPVYLS